LLSTTSASAPTTGTAEADVHDPVSSNSSNVAARIARERIRSARR
jgi:hypothetical protein